HDVGNAEPLLIAVTWLDNAQHYDLRFGTAGTFGCPINGSVAFLGVVNDHEIFALVAGFVAAALAAHGRDAPVRSYARLDTRAGNGGTTAAAPTRRFSPN